jgi:uncharacterized protein (DUF169 family)
LEITRRPSITDYRSLEQRLLKSLGLERRAVAVTFLEVPPAGVIKFTGTMPSGCSFWRIAAEGQAFYTVPSDHYNCPVGSYTHNIALPEARANELGQTLTIMSDAGYIKMEEIPGIARLARSPGAVVYAPLGDTPVDPDVVIFSGRPGRVMLLEEAALRAGIEAKTPLLGRPTCMALPAALTQGFVASTGCIGNRIYTELGEDELYVVVPGNVLARLADEAETIAAANLQLAAYHNDRRQTLTGLV